jgi:hypothetical protein
VRWCRCAAAPSAAAATHSQQQPCTPTIRMHLRVGQQLCELALQVGVVEHGVGGERDRVRLEPDLCVVCVSSI